MQGNRLKAMRKHRIFEALRIPQLQLVAMVLRYTVLSIVAWLSCTALLAQGMQRVHVLHAPTPVQASQGKYLMEAAERVDAGAVVSLRGTKVLVSTRPEITSESLMTAFNATPGVDFTLSPGQQLPGEVKMAPPGAGGFGATPGDSATYQMAKAAWIAEHGIDPGDPNTLIHE